MKKPDEFSEPLAFYGAILESDALNLIARVRKGIAYSLFSHLVSRSPFSLSDWSGFLHISERSLQRYKKDQKSFDALQSEKIVEISRLYQRGLEVFSEPSKLDSWLVLPSVALGGKAPKSFLDSSFGIQLISDELGRMEHGILA